MTNSANDCTHLFRRRVDFLRNKFINFDKKFTWRKYNTMAKKYCYLFTEGNANMREILGGKGANLAEMTNIGLPVPQG